MGSDVGMLVHVKQVWAAVCDDGVRIDEQRLLVLSGKVKRAEFLHWPPVFGVVVEVYQVGTDADGVGLHGGSRQFEQLDELGSVGDGDNRTLAIRCRSFVPPKHSGSIERDGGFVELGVDGVVVFDRPRKPIF